jgi:aromatic ring-opening dioxygenase catalytic subunit (LigB family)
VLSCGVLQTGERDDFLALGAALGEAIARMDGGRVAILGSGGMSHTFWPLSEIRDHFGYDSSHVISPQARAIDADFLAHFRAGEHAAVVERYPEYLAKYRPEGRFAHYLMALGAMGGPSCTAPGLQLSRYENAVGTGQVHVLFPLQPLPDAQQYVYREEAAS